MTTAVLLLGLATHAISALPADDVPAPRIEFTRLVAHWDQYGGTDYVDFIRDAHPDVAQLGFYGAHFWSLGHTAQFDGYPAHFPVRGLRELGDWFEKRNAEIHREGVKVVGHFNVEFLIGDPDGPDGPTGFFKFYRDLWDESVLGPKPVADPIELLEIGADGQPIRSSTYKIGGMNEHWACLRNPHWQVVLKAWVKHAISRGVDGLIANYFYRHDCLCTHCQTAFQAYLADRFTPEQLRDQFGVTDLATHRFSEIVSWHPPAETTPLRLEMLRFSQISNKQVFDEVFVRYGRSLKPDFIVAQWNHLGDFSQVDGDERCLLPTPLWGRDESYLWYSTGGAACFTDLKRDFLGDGTLQARYIRGAFDDKPFTLGKYESTRIRSAIAELAANGGAPMGFYTRFTDPAARAEIVRYYQFLGRNDDLFRANRPHADVALAFPRKAVHRGDVTAVDSFRKLGRVLLDAHVLFDVWPDDALPPDHATRYARIITTNDDPSTIVANLPARRSRFEAPVTVRASASRPAGSDTGIDIHLVNYNRIEPPLQADGQPSPGAGIVDEKPIAAPTFKADIVLPEGAICRSIQFVTPESEAPVALTPDRSEPGRVQLTVPEFLVYGILRIEFQPSP